MSVFFGKCIVSSDVSVREYLAHCQIFLSKCSERSETFPILDRDELLYEKDVSDSGERSFVCLYCKLADNQVVSKEN